MRPQYKELAILITRRIKVFFVSTAELPVVEERVAVTICGGIRLQSVRQEDATAAGCAQAERRGSLKKYHGGGGFKVDLPFGVSG